MEVKTMVEKTVEKSVVKTSLGVMKTSLGGVKTSLEVMKTSLEVVKTSLGVMKTSLGVVETSLEVVKTSLEVVKTSLGKACMRTTHLLLLGLQVLYPSRHQYLRRSYREVQQLRLTPLPDVVSTAFPISSSQVEVVSPGHLFQGKFHLQSGSLS